MKILFATENSYSGGLDSFLVNLINHWPHPGDQLVLLCNRSHPGLEVVVKRVCRDLLVVPHDVPLLWEILNKLDQWRWPRLVRKILSAGLRYPYLVFYIARMAFEIRKIAADRMMIVNGGVPGGGTCRAAGK